ncbi:MAG: RagB/SusD family nutrient uptake outer membrane protein [Tannerellaceae bacterium]|nr:RagB/SusD family nutrient uptake outer membrane protein [Tannerellaceae bacterium]
MKKINNIFIIGCLFVWTCISCSDILDTPAKSALEDEVIFTNVGLSEGMITAILHSFGETNSYRNQLLHFYGSNTDVEWYSSSETTTDARAELTAYAAKPNNTRFNDNETDPWSKVYEAVQRANIAIQGFERYSDIENNKELAQLYGEVLTLRAVLYYDLVKFWGDVPARFEPVNNETIYIPRTDRDIIFKQLIADLKIASDYLGWPNETARTSSVENVNKAFAKGLRARICLAAAGHSQRYDGTIKLSDDPELSKANLYPIVIEECLDIINSRTCTLGEFEQNFRYICQDVVAAGNESIWEIPFAEGRGRTVYCFGIKHDNVANDPYVKIAQGGMIGPLPTFFYEYDEDDIRRDITCIPYQWDYGVQKLNKVSQWFFGKYRYEWMNRVVTSSGYDDGVNWQVMRLADVYLMAAEAINEIQTPAAAAEYLRPIRERAFPNNPEKVTEFMANATASKENFFEAIVQERALEFAGEMLRKADLIRWNRLQSSIESAKEKMYDL